MKQELNLMDLVHKLGAIRNRDKHLVVVGDGEGHFHTNLKQLKLEDIKKTIEVLSVLSQECTRDSGGDNKKMKQRVEESPSPDASSRVDERSVSEEITGSSTEEIGQGIASGQAELLLQAIFASEDFKCRDSDSEDTLEDCYNLVKRHSKINNKRKLVDLTEISNSPREVESQRLYSCSICGKTFTHPQALGGHKSSHNKVKKTKEEETKHKMEDRMLNLIRESYSQRNRSPKEDTQPDSRTNETSDSQEIDKIRDEETVIGRNAAETGQEKMSVESTDTPEVDKSCDSDSEKTLEDCNNVVNTKFDESVENSSILQKLVSERQYSCSICGKSFSHPQALGGHKSSHSKPKKTKEERKQEREARQASRMNEKSVVDGEKATESSEKPLEKWNNIVLTLYKLNNKNKSADSVENSVISGRSFCDHQALGVHKSDHNKSEKANEERGQQIKALKWLLTIESSGQDNESLEEVSQPAQEVLAFDLNELPPEEEC